MNYVSYALVAVTATYCFSGNLILFLEAGNYGIVKIKAKDGDFIAALQQIRL